MNNDLAINLYQSISNSNEERVFKMWHCSSIAECPRSHYFKRKGIPTLNKPTAAKVLRWRAGHLIEEVIRPHLLSLYPDLTSNVRMRNKTLDLTGEYDNYSKDKKTLIEIKSVHVFAPKNIEKEGRPYLNHEYQNHAYKLLMETPGTEVLVDKDKDVWEPMEKMEVEHITYIYIALDGRILALETDVQENILVGIKKRLELLRIGLAGLKLPPCFCKEDHPLYKSTTQWCDYRDEANKKCCEVQDAN